MEAEAMAYLLYFLIALCATTAGALTGMGGGILIKPVLDILGDFDAANIGVLSSATVLAMAVVSTARQMTREKFLPTPATLWLIAGSVGGGIAGERLLTWLIKALQANRAVVVTQNITLAVIIVAIFLYMQRRDRIKSLGLTLPIAALCTGLFLGILSSFLGIGGGPINVALLMFVFSWDVKRAAACSLLTILFSQGAKVAMVALSTGFSPYDVSMLAVMIPGAVIGGFLGSLYRSRLSDKTVGIAFNGIQTLVFVFCLWNIVKNI